MKAPFHILLLLLAASAPCAFAQGIHWSYATRITQRFDVAPGVKAPAAPAPLSVPYPPYPVALEYAGISGKATLQFRVTPEGRPAEIKVTTATHPEFGAAATEAVKTWRFRPLAEHRPGYPANVLVQAIFVFEMPDL